ncbi:competence type IV pilus minor pilin ComGD [Staphylococcus borealis]|uniref:competence type IV pilus minor pilin ComGD n=1 Tax=Staphylococcus borealis TaxID=2742203 RepID=UPI002174D30A|nr:competence type IV pilus minor pilin ComGD [Staphylococcus borealis]
MRQLRINKLPGFTLLETLLTLIILIIFLNISPYIYKTNHLNLFESRLKINNIIAQFEYLKSKAIAENQSITIVLNKNASEMKVIEQNGKKYTLSLFGAKITSVVKVQTLTFNNEGKINHFGSIILKCKTHIYRIIFHIDKGRIRFVKLSS